MLTLLTDGQPAVKNPTAEKTPADDSLVINQPITEITENAERPVEVSVANDTDDNLPTQEQVTREVIKDELERNEKKLHQAQRKLLTAKFLLTIFGSKSYKSGTGAVLAIAGTLLGMLLVFLFSLIVPFSRLVYALLGLIVAVICGILFWKQNLRVRRSMRRYLKKRIRILEGTIDARQNYLASSLTSALDFFEELSNASPKDEAN